MEIALIQATLVAMPLPDPLDSSLHRLPKLRGTFLDYRRGMPVADGESHERFRPTGVLGAGGFGQVIAVEDRNLMREIAMKNLLPDYDDETSLDTLITEARITSSLEHPGIVPVYDLDVSTDGQIYYTMRRVHGRSLGALLTEALRTGERPAPIGDNNAVVTTLLKVCDTLAYAHSRGVVHQDLKPDNLMLGDFGEVLVLDWGASSIMPKQGEAFSQPRVQFGTPAFMSPEQARGEPLDARSDIWSLGATLFQVLFLRLPFEHTDPETFWTGKRAGTLLVPGQHELDVGTRPLAAIALRAMHAEVQSRYQTVADFASDLRAYQAGYAIVAYRGSPWERFLRWHRHWGRSTWITLAVACVIASVGWFVWGERLKQMSTWGRPVVAEDYVDESWQQRWSCSSDHAFTLQEGRLVSTAAGAAVAWCRRPFSGPVAIEFDGEMTASSRPGDLSVLWSDGPSDPDYRKFPRRGWALQAGAYDNSFCAIYRVIDGRLDQVARRPVRLVAGKTYRIGAEIEECTLRLRVDGKIVAEFEDVLPIMPGHVGIYGYYPGKAFDNLLIYSRGVAERVSSIALGDDNLNEGLYARAIDRYRRVLDSHPHGPIADEAWYKTGYSYLLAGNPAGAWAAWNRVVAPPYQDRVACHELDRLFSSGQHDDLLSRFGEVANRSPASHAQAEGLWSKWVDLLTPRKGEPVANPLLERYLVIRQTHFPTSAASVSAYGKALNSMGRWDQTIAECGDDPLSVADALASLGRIADDEQRFGHVGGTRAWVRCQMGDLESNLAPMNGGDRSMALCKLGRIAQARLENEGHSDWRILAARGAWTELAASTQADGRALGLIAQGRISEAIAGNQRAGLPPSAFATALLGNRTQIDSLADRTWNTAALRLIVALEAGSALNDDRLRQTLEVPIDWSRTNAWFGPLIAAPLLTCANGPSEAWNNSLAQAMAVKERAGQRTWYLASYISDRISAEQLLAQPFRAEAEAWLRLGTGLRADALGDRAAARQAYQAFIALPLQMRLLRDFTLDPEIERFVAWRLRSARALP